MAQVREGAALAEFILSFVQALLRTGYYLPDHPQAQKAKAGLHQRFSALFHGRHELTFMVEDVGGGASGIVVEGALAEPQRLRSLMAAGMAEVYATRLAQFLERKQLVALTLKEGMAEDHFCGFVDVLSEPCSAALDAAGKERFLARLRQRGVRGFSLVFREDLVREDRRLPWRVQLAVARLRKDLHAVPIFNRLDEAGLHAVRQQVLHDVLRPVRQADLLAALLLNSDLAETDQMPASDIESEIVTSTPDALLLPTLRSALRGHLGSADEGAERRRRALARLALHARAREVAGALESLRELFDRGIVELALLPAELRAQIEREQAVDRYLAAGPAFRGGLEVEWDAAGYEEKASWLTGLAPELLRRNLLDELLVLLTLLGGHAALGGPRAAVAARLLKELTGGPVAAQLKERFLEGRKEDRIALIPIYRLLGEGMEGQLLEVLREAEDPWVRKYACEELLHLGPRMTHAVLVELARGSFTSDAIAELLMVFGEVGDDSPEVVQTLRAYSRHVEPRVREEAAWALCRVVGRPEEDTFLRLLEDPDLGVRKRALRCLRVLRSPRAFAHVVALLRRAEQEGHLHALEPHLVAALPDLAEACGAPCAESERYLVERLRRGQARGLRGLLQRAQGAVDERESVAIWRTLGFVGGETSLPVLGEAAHSASPAGRRAAGEALARLQRRVA